MKQMIDLRFAFVFAFILTVLNSCSNDDSGFEDSTNNKALIGKWVIDRHWGSIDGKETIRFSENWTYSMTFDRVEDFTGPCSMDPYCDNDFSGKYWFEGGKIYYDHSSLGWLEYWDTWSVEGDLLILDGDVYRRL